MGTWMGAVSDELDTLVAPQRTRFPQPFLATNWGGVVTFIGNAGVWLGSSGAGDAYVELNVPQGCKLATLVLRCVGNASANLTLSVEQSFIANVANNSIASIVLNALSGPGDQTFNLLAASTGLTVTVNAAGATFTRSAGSFLTDGFLPNMPVVFAGLTNAGNNGSRIISTVTATVITVTSNTGMVNEVSTAGAASVSCVSPTIDSTFGLQLKLTASATGVGVKGMRDAFILQ